MSDQDAAPLRLRPPPVSPAGATLDEQPQDLPTPAAKDVQLDAEAED